MVQAESDAHDAFDGAALPPVLPPVLVVTGISGAGKSTTLKALEDLGFEAVDNVPQSLFAPLLAAPTERKLAIGVDARTRAFDPKHILDSIAELAKTGRIVRLLFLDCDGSELVKRFSETRRRHPLATDRPAMDGIAWEREILQSLRRAADIVIDTSDFSSNDLRREIGNRFRAVDGDGITLTLMSFGYSRGVPRDADLVFDMRFLKNPHWDPALRPLTGLAPEVAAHVMADPAYTPAFDAIMALLALLLPGYAREGRAYVTVAFGCTGGRHRSVAVAEAAAIWLDEKGWSNSVVHRDRARDSIDETEDKLFAVSPEEGNT